MENQTISIYNQYNLGDQIFNCILFYNIKEYIETHNIIINYYCKKIHHPQVCEFICSPNINLLEYGSAPDNHGYQLWIGNKDFTINWHEEYRGKAGDDLDVIICCVFNEFLQRQNIPITLDSLEYHDSELVDRYARINERFPDKYSDLDILILNSKGFSGQYYIKDEEWTPLIYQLNNKYKVVTSTKVDGVNCTFDDGLTVKDIAAISTRCKKIIAVNSGCVPGLFNKYTLNNVEVVYYFENRATYKFKNFVKPGHVSEILAALSKS